MFCMTGLNLSFKCLVSLYCVETSSFYCLRPLSCVSPDQSLVSPLRWRWSRPTTRRWPVTGTSRLTRSSRSSTSWFWPPAAPSSCRTSRSPPARSSFKILVSCLPPAGLPAVDLFLIALLYSLICESVSALGTWPRAEAGLDNCLFFSRFLFIYKLVVASTICITEVVSWQ